MEEAMEAESEEVTKPKEDTPEKGCEAGGEVVRREVVRRESLSDSDAVAMEEDAPPPQLQKENDV